MGPRSKFVAGAAWSAWSIRRSVSAHEHTRQVRKKRAAAQHRPREGAQACALAASGRRWKLNEGFTQAAPPLPRHQTAARPATFQKPSSSPSSGLGTSGGWGWRGGGRVEALPGLRGCAQLSKRTEEGGGGAGNRRPRGRVHWGYNHFVQRGPSLYAQSPMGCASQRQARPHTGPAPATTAQQQASRAQHTTTTAHWRKQEKKSCAAKHT